MNFAHGLFGFLVIAVYLPWLPQSASESRWSIIGIGASLMMFIERRAQPVSFNNTVLAFTVLLGWATLSLCWSENFSLSFGRWIELFFLALVFYHGITSRYYDQVLKGLVAGVAVSGVLVPLQLFGLNVITQWSPPSGLMYSKLYLVEVAVPLLLVAIARGWWWSALVCASAAILPSSRAAWLAAIAGFSPLVIARRPRWRSLIIIGTLLSLAVMLVVSFWLNTTTLQHRFAIWSWTLSQVTMFGHGIGSYPVMFGAAHAHNDFFEVAYELGWVGLIFFFTALARLPRDGEEWPAVLSILILSLASFPLQNPASSFVFALLAGQLVARSANVCSGDDIGRDAVAADHPFGSRNVFGYPKRQ